MSQDAPVDTRAILAKALVEIRDLKARLAQKEKTGHRDPVAIVGMACRLPGHANSPEVFWQLLRNGVDAMTEIPSERWNIDDYFDPDPAAAGKVCTRWGGFIDAVDRFDAQFFGISPREAVHMDPQQRLLLEVGWEALENAGIPPDRLANSRTGVYVGIGAEEYTKFNVHAYDPRRLTAYDLGSDLSLAAGRLAFTLGLQGPAMSVDTTCSSGLVALHLAVQGLRIGECDLALVGGVNLLLTPEPFVVLSRSGALSTSGRCKTFDASGDGYARGEGCVVLVVKRLADARRDGDPIQAVIRGTAVNHDGPASGLTVPNGMAQRAVIRQALENGALEPTQVDYLEAHGTGTALGDPIEVAAFGDVLGSGRAADAPLMVGSVKTNIGHLESAAGISGVLKVVLAMQNEAIPPHLHFDTLNAHIDLTSIPAQVVTKLTPWRPNGKPRIAGVSSFGMSGTNAHMVLEEAPKIPTFRDHTKGDRAHLVPLSARSLEALFEHAANCRSQLARETAIEVRDYAYSAAQRRAHHNFRLAIATRSREELIGHLESYLRGESSPAVSTGERVPGRRFQPAFVFSGQGAQWHGMAQGLLEEPVFRAKMEECNRAFATVSGFSILDELTKDEGASRLDDTEVAQPAIVCVQLALAALWESYGVIAEAVTGHSVGEVTAATFAGILSLEDAMRVVYHRARLMQRATGGGKMAAVGLSVEEAETIVADHRQRLSVAAVNAPRSVVLSGEEDTLEEVLAILRTRGVAIHKMAVNYAFHSPQMDAIRTELITALRGIKLHEPTRAIYSTVSGAPARAGDYGPEYWARNVRERVRFAEALRLMLEGGCNTVVEVAPHPVLHASISQNIEALGSAATVHVSARRRKPETPTFLRSVGDLYCAGFPVDWKTPTNGGSFVRLPTYPWQRERYWVDEAPARNPEAGTTDTLTQLDLPWPVFQTRFSRERWPVSDRQVWDVPILPFAAIVETVLEAGARVEHGAVALRHLDLREPTWLLRGEASLQIVLRPLSGNDGRAHTFEVFTKDGEAWRIVASGTLAASTRRRATVDVGDDARGEPLPEGALARKGIPIPLARCVRDLWRSGDRVTARVELPGDAVDIATSSGVHPIVLESSLDLLNAAAGTTDAWLPAHCELVELGAKERPALIEATLRETTSDGLVGDVRILGERGDVVLVVQGLVLRKSDDEWRKRAIAARVADSLFVPVWRNQRLAEDAALDTGKSWLIFSDRGGFGEKLAKLVRERGDACTLAFPAGRYATAEDGSLQMRPGEAEDYQRCLRAARADRVIHLWSLDHQGLDSPSGPLKAPGVERTALESTLRLFQAAVAAADRPPRIWLVTRGAHAVHEADAGGSDPYQMALWGLGRSVATEHADLLGGLVDLDAKRGMEDAQVGMLLKEIGSGRESEREDQVAYRGARRFVLRVGVTPLTMQTSPFDPRGHDTVLITGGLGGLGLELAKRLAKTGATRLVLMGRQPPSPSAQAVIHEIERLGVRCAAIQCDVADRDALAAALREIQKDGALTGVVHAAGAVQDAPLVRQTWEHFETVLRPKLRGAFNLHELTRSMSLRYFVMFGSMAALLGAPAQGNYAAANAFLDGLAHYRRAHGLPAVTVDWGPWGEAGMAARLGELGDSLLRSRGVSPIPLSEGMNLLGRIVAGDAPTVGAMAVDWSRYVTQYSRGVPAMYAEVATVESTSGPSLHDTLRETPPPKRRQTLLRHVQDLVRRVLMLPSSVPVHPEQGFREMGMDSLMAVMLRNALQKSTGGTLSATLAFDYPNVAAMTDFLLSTVLRVGADDDARETAPNPDHDPLQREREARRDRLESEAANLSEEEAQAELLRELALPQKRKTL